MDATSVFLGLLLGVGIYWVIDSLFAWRAEGTPALYVSEPEGYPKTEQIEVVDGKEVEL